MNELQTSQPIGMLSVIERAIKDPSIDVGKMERIIALAIQLQERESKAAFDAAMSAAQSEMRTISRDCHNPQTRSRYASYELIEKAIRPIYTSHGFAMCFGSRAAAQPDHVIATCRVTHRAGHSETVELDMPADGKGAKGNDMMTKTHATGSALSYAKRYIANLVWNLSFGEADDDGNSAGQFHQTQPRQQPTPATKAAVLSSEATEKTRDYMFDALRTEFGADVVLQFLGIAEPSAWPLAEVPTSKPALGELSNRIAASIAKRNDAQPASGDKTEPFWSAIITVPRAGTKRAEYMQNPDTIRSLYDAMKAGDDDARTRLFGLANEWAPRPWTGKDNKERPPSQSDVDCRAALDQFLDYEQTKGQQL